VSNRVALLTNIPAPYRLPFFNELDRYWICAQRRKGAKDAQEFREIVTGRQAEACDRWLDAASCGEVNELREVQQRENVLSGRCRKRLRLLASHKSLDRI
jgi:hypothetical protein